MTKLLERISILETENKEVSLTQTFDCYSL